VIAADLIRRLPPSLSVQGVVTFGSPLANDTFDAYQFDRTLKEPPANLAWWVNFWNPLDPITCGRGLSARFNWLVDMRVATRLDAHTHDAITYLNDESVSNAIGYALFGSL